MDPNIQSQKTTGKFDLLFDKLNEAIEDQKEHLVFDFQPDSEINQTISLFREYQDSVSEQSFTTFTRS